MHPLRWWPLLLLLACDARSSGVRPIDAPGGDLVIDPAKACEGARRVLAERCTACHRPGGQTPDLIGDAVAATIGAASALYSGAILVVSGDPEASLLLRKMSGTQASGEGGRMPPSGPLPAAEVEVVSAWIRDGAPLDCAPPTDVTPTRNHPEGWADPAMHGLALKLGELPCRDCHGADFTGQLGPSCDSCHRDGWRTECTYCHGGTDNESGAPPRDLNGELADLTFTAHTAHGSARNHAPFDCIECHAKPTDVTSAGHVLDDTPARAEIAFTSGRSGEGVYQGDGACANLWCHGNGRGANGAWSVAQGRPGCNDCHGGPGGGRDAWGRMSGAHEDHLREGLACADCHGGTVDGTNQIVGLELHVNRTVDVVTVPEITRTAAGCTGTCHGELHSGAGWTD